MIGTDLVLTDTDRTMARSGHTDHLPHIGPVHMLDIYSHRVEVHLHRCHMFQPCCMSNSQSHMDHMSVSLN
jgi:hypothetical protein